MKMNHSSLPVLMSVVLIMNARLSNGYTNPINDQTTEVIDNNMWDLSSYNLYVGGNTWGNSMVVTNNGFVRNDEGYIGYTINAFSNSVLITGPGSVWSNSSHLLIGSDGSYDNTLDISNGGTVLNHVAAIGAKINGQIGSNSNQVRISGTESRWISSHYLYIGSYGSGNSLEVSDGAHVYSLAGHLGWMTNANDNSVLVSDSGTVWSNTHHLQVGYQGSGNRLYISGGGAVFAGSFASIGAQSYSSDNSVMVSGAGSFLSVTDALEVGSYGRNNTLVITNEGIAHSESGMIGTESTALNNSVIVTGADSVWTNSAEIRIGFNGSSNSLLIANGGQVDCSFAALGANNAADNNSVMVSDTGSVWNINGGLNIGTRGSSNTLTVINGAVIQSDAVYLGLRDTAVENQAHISGIGSKWNSDYAMRIGADGSGNTLTISDGGCVENALWATIGHGSSSSSNQVTVIGTGSLWRTGTSLEIGNEGSGDSLVISNGGRVENGTRVNIGDATGALNNSVKVDGTNTTWVITEGLRVGRQGYGNSLTIRNGAYVESDAGGMGTLSNSGDNTVTIEGVGSEWHARQWLNVGNGGQRNSLHILNGGLALSTKGSVGAYASSSNNSAIVNGNGSRWNCYEHLSVGGTSEEAGGIGNSVMVTNGAAISTPLLMVYPSNSFNLATGGRLEAGVIIGDLNVDGIFALGNSTTNGSMSGDLTVNLGGMVEVEIGGYVLGSEFDHLSITGLTALAGTFDVVFTNAFVPMFGKFDLFDYIGGITGTFDTVNLPILPEGKTWNTDNLYTTGELMILPEPTADSNGNGIADGWEFVYFGAPISATNNPDTDPLDNYEEFIAGTDPTNGASFFQISNAAHKTGGFVVEWEPAISDRSYSVNWSTNLLTGFQPLVTGIEYPHNSCTDMVHGAENRCFYSVEVQLK